MHEHVIHEHVIHEHVTHEHVIHERSWCTTVVNRVVVVAFVDRNKMVDEMFLNQVQTKLSRVETNYR